MEIKNALFTVLFAGICINAAFAAMGYVGIDPIPLTPWDETQFETNMNASALVGSMSSRSDDYYGNIIDAIRTIWNTNLPVIESFTEFLSNMGVPTFIIDLFRVPYRVLIVWSLFYLWRGG
jgi:hypothetical protein